MDHFLQIPQVGREWEDMLESYTTLGYLAGVTERIRLGTLVTGITYRNLAAPGEARRDARRALRRPRAVRARRRLVRARAPALRLGASRRCAERFARLEDALELLPLMWGPGAPRFEGRTVTVEEAICYPRPLQERIPILVGGSGERRTLRLVARHADACNLFGDPATVRRKVAVLHEHCAAEGRDPATIAVTHLAAARVIARRRAARRGRRGDRRRSTSAATASSPRRACRRRSSACATTAGPERSRRFADVIAAFRADEARSAGAMGIYAAAGNSSRTYLHRFLARAGEAVEPGQLVLDAGSGRAPYRKLFSHARYETADFVSVRGKKYVEPDYVCDLAQIPVEDARFDHVLLTQVLEHIPEPATVLAELNRVLKPGGTLWLTAPLFYAEHERPYDIFTLHRYGLRHCARARASGARDRLDGGLPGHAELPGQAAQPLPAGLARGLRRRPARGRAGVRREAFQARGAARVDRAREPRSPVQVHRPRAAEELPGDRGEAGYGVTMPDVVLPPGRYLSCAFRVSHRRRAARRARCCCATASSRARAAPAGGADARRRARLRRSGATMLRERGLLTDGVGLLNIYEHYREHGWGDQEPTGEELADLGAHRIARGTDARRRARGASPTACPDERLRDLRLPAPRRLAVPAHPGVRPGRRAARARARSSRSAPDGAGRR